MDPLLQLPRAGIELDEAIAHIVILGVGLGEALIDTEGILHTPRFNVASREGTGVGQVRGICSVGLLEEGERTITHTLLGIVPPEHKGNSGICGVEGARVTQEVKGLHRTARGLCQHPLVEVFAGLRLSCRVRGGLLGAGLPSKREGQQAYQQAYYSFVLYSLFASSISSNLTASAV